MPVSIALSIRSLLSVIVFTITTTSNNSNKLFAAAQSCDFGPDALTNTVGQPVPQTCIDVPFDDGSGVLVMQSRCYYTYVPRSESCSSKFSPDEPVPVVFDVHGYESCPLYSAGYTGWKEQADKDCFVVVWPSGNTGVPGTMGTCWNLPGGLQADDYGMQGGNNIKTVPCCCVNVFTSEVPKIDDPLFLRMAIEKVLEDFSETAWEEEFFGSVRIDASRVYMAGHSNGCMTSLSMAALHSDVVAAVCCHSGAVVTPFDEDLYINNNSPVPIWMIHGVKDDTVPFDGVERVFPLLDAGFWSVPDTLEYLSEVNGCTEEGAMELAMKENSIDSVVRIDATSSNSDPETIVGTFFKRTNCTKGATVELVTLLESGHFPFPNYPEYLLMEETKTTIDTTAMAWEFCSAQSKSPSQKPEAVVVSEEEPQPLTPPEEEDIKPFPSDNDQGEEPEPKPEEEDPPPSVEEAIAEEDSESTSQEVEEAESLSSGSAPRFSFAQQGFGIDKTLLLLLSLVLLSL